MTWSRSVLVCGVILVSTVSAETRWTHLESANFEMFTTASESNARETLRNFEQVRGFFQQALRKGTGTAKDQPVYIVGFNSEKEYAPYRPNEFATAYYHPGADRDYIVMSKVGYDFFRLAVHEYVHLVVKHANLNFPPWLNEGLAEVYSTLKPSGNRVMVGDPILGRLQGLRSDKWVPLEIIVAADHNSPYYNEKNRAGSLYNEGWALVHMLALNDDYRPKFGELIAALADGGDSIAVLKRVYGKSVQQIDKELQAYTRGGQFRALLFPVSLDKAKDVIPAQPAAEFEVNLALADLVNRVGHEQDARDRLEKLAQTNPQRPEPWAGLGYLAWRKGDMEATAKNFEKAFELGDRNPRLLWDYGRIAMRGQAEQALKALEALAELQPNRVEVRLQIAANHLSARRAGRAYALLNEIKKVGADDAARMFTLMAYAQLGLGSAEAAGTSIEQGVKYAKSEFDKGELDRLREYVGQAQRQASTLMTALPRQAETIPSAQSEEEQPKESPTLTRTPRLAVRTTATEYALPSSVSGTFAEFVCGESLRIAIDSDAGRKTFLIPDPKKIVVSGIEGGTLDLNCGPQKLANVRVEYGPSVTPGVDGILLILYFEK